VGDTGAAHHLFIVPGLLKLGWSVGAPSADLPRLGLFGGSEVVLAADAPFLPALHEINHQISGSSRPTPAHPPP